jgi:hypothetical protein
MTYTVWTHEKSPKRLLAFGSLQLARHWFEQQYRYRTVKVWCTYADGDESFLGDYRKETHP